MDSPSLQLASDMDLVREMFVEYSRELGDDFCFQGFQHELQTLPGRYASPQGRILLASVEGVPAGIVALRPFEGVPGGCEMKRMYVRPENRGLGIGRQLAETVLQEAVAVGYQRMLLDTLERLEAAIALYRSLGFKDIEAYYDNPIAGVVYMEKELA